MRFILLAFAIVIASSAQFPIVTWVGAAHPVASPPPAAAAVVVAL